MDNEIVTFSLKDSYKNYSVMYRPQTPDFVGDIDLHWDAEKILFSQGSPKRFDLYEMGLSDPAPKKVTTIPDADVNNFDGSVHAVQKIPSYGKKVLPKIEDKLVDNSWPKFLHPVPLGSDSHKESAAKVFLVSARIGANSSRNFSIYLTDIYDNMVLLATDSDPKVALLEPLPIKKTKRVPLIPDRINPNSKEATVFIQNIYCGQGLRDVPRGSVKKLLVIEYHHAYPGMSGKRHQIELRIIRGGSWYNLPKQATAGHLMAYPKWQPVYDVGFRVVMVD